MSITQQVAIKHSTDGVGSAQAEMKIIIDCNIFTTAEYPDLAVRL